MTPLLRRRDRGREGLAPFPPSEPYRRFFCIRRADRTGTSGHVAPGYPLLAMGAIGGGLGGSPMWLRIRCTGAASVMKATMRTVSAIGWIAAVLVRRASVRFGSLCKVRDYAKLSVGVHSDHR